MRGAGVKGRLEASTVRDRKCGRDEANRAEPERASS